MNVVVSRSDYERDLRRAVRHFGDYGPVMLHTDLLRIGVLDRRGTKDEVCGAHVDCLQDVFEGRPLIFPTFNYTFYRTRLYDVLSDPCQIGVLNEYVRRRYPDRRTLTPVFNHVIVNDHDFGTGFHANPFGREDIFWQAMQRRGLACMLGPGLSNSTFQHVAEDAADVPYRYRKTFRGKVRSAVETLEVVFEPQVLPLDPQARSLIIYEWDRLQKILEGDGALVCMPLGRATVLIYDLAACFQRYTWLLERNILCALTPASQESILRYLDRLGGPMTVGNMEPGWTGA